MSDYPKYRLKKDTPEFEAGQMFTRGRDEYDNDCLFAGGAPLPAFDITLIDNFDEWFEEAKEEREVKEKPKWVRKQIEQIEFGEHKSVYVVIRFVKSQNYIGYDNELGDVIASNEDGEIKKIWLNANESKFWRQKDYDILNQMIRDGYIEIQDNSNIVWEEEKCD